MLFSVEYRLFFRAFNKATAHGRVGDYGRVGDKFQPVRYFFFASLRYVWIATNISAEKFSWSSDM